MTKYYNRSNGSVDILNNDPIDYVEVKLTDQRFYPTKVIKNPTYAYYKSDANMFVVESVNPKKTWLFPREQIVGFTIHYKNGEENEV